MDWEPPSDSGEMPEFPVLYLSRKKRTRSKVEGNSTTTYNYKVRNKGTGMIVRETERSTTITVSREIGVFDEVDANVSSENFIHLIERRNGPWDCWEEIPECTVEGVVTHRYERDEIFSESEETSGEIDSDTDVEETEKRWSRTVSHVEGVNSEDSDGCLEIDTRNTVPENLSWLESVAVLCLGDSDDYSEEETVTATYKLFRSTLIETGSATEDTGWIDRPAGGEQRTVDTCSGYRSSIFENETFLSDPVTKVEAATAAREKLVDWMQRIEQLCGSDSFSDVEEECSALLPVCSAECVAKMMLDWPTEGDTTGAAVYTADIAAFQYRWKLDQCCRNQKIRMEWDEVFYPREFLEWLEVARMESEPSDPPVLPTITKKAWVWEGEPPGCDEFASGFDDEERYANETMWSPWGLPVLVPPGQQGIVALRNLLVDCNPDSPWGSKPELMIGVLPRYDESDLDENEDTEI
jgi:hypothetical protein